MRSLIFLISMLALSMPSHSNYYPPTQRCADGQFLVRVANTVNEVQRICIEVISRYTGERVRQIYDAPPSGVYYTCLPQMKGMNSYMVPNFDVFAVPFHQKIVGRIRFDFDLNRNPVEPIADIEIVWPTIHLP